MKWNLDFRSIKFRVWMNFLLYAGILLLLMWFLQIFFLNNYYEEMKKEQARDTARSVASMYTLNTSPQDDSARLTRLIQEADKVTVGDDIYISISDGDSFIYPEVPDIARQAEIGQVVPQVQALLQSTDLISDTISHSIIDEDTGREVSYIYATVLEDGDRSLVLYLVSPLTPIASTITILQNQMVLIIIISLILAFLLALWLSTRITRPITRITRSAHKLAEGEYGTTFPIRRNEYSEINNLSETLNTASVELEKTVTLQKDLMANVSHDLRTPLTMIRSYAEMVRDLSGDVPEKREAHLNVIIEETDRLNTLVNDVMALSKMQAGTMTLEMSEFNLKDAIQSVLNPYEILEEQEGYHIRFQCRDDDIIVKADEERIKQVVSNLLTNAIKYGGADKEILLNVRHWGRRVHVEVVDHGAGIDPEELEHIWDRYYKASTNHVRTATGSGLGLSIVKEILTLHHAKFGVESKVGHGTTFWFELLTNQQPLQGPPAQIGGGWRGGWRRDR